MRFSPGIKLLAVFAISGAGVCVPALALDMGAGVYYLSLAVLAGIFFTDLLISAARPAAVQPVFPETVRLSKNRDSSLVFQLKTRKASIKTIKIALKFDETGIDSPFEKDVKITDETTRVSWEMTGLRQGTYPLDTCWVQLSSRMGLWQIKQPFDINCRIHVYPDIAGERKNLAALFTGAGYGVHTRKQIGKGREFERLREYLPGDNYEDIYWKATARRGAPVTKIFQTEKTQDVYVMLDASRLSARKADSFSGKDTKNSENILEKFITTSLTLGLAAQRQGDKFGLGVFSDRMERFLPAGSKKSHYNLCRDALFTMKPRHVTPDFSEWITFTGNKIRKRAMLILLTSMDDPAVADTFLEHIHILSRRHLVIVNMLAPANTAPLFSSEQVNSVEDIYNSLGGHLQWHFLSGVERSLRRMGVGFRQHHSSDLTFNIISQYLEIKQRQAL